MRISMPRLSVFLFCTLVAAVWSATAAAASGDFNADEDVGTVADAGAVNVLYGTSTGLAAANDQFWQQDAAGVEDDADQFGSAHAPKR